MTLKFLQPLRSFHDVIYHGAEHVAIRAAATSLEERGLVSVLQRRVLLPGGMLSGLLLQGRVLRQRKVLLRLVG